MQGGAAQTHPASSLTPGQDPAPGYAFRKTKSGLVLSRTANRRRRAAAHSDQPRQQAVRSARRTAGGRRHRPRKQYPGTDRQGPRRRSLATTGERMMTAAGNCSAIPITAARPSVSSRKTAAHHRRRTVSFSTPTCPIGRRFLPPGQSGRTAARGGKPQQGARGGARPCQGQSGRRAARSCAPGPTRFGA